MNVFLKTKFSRAIRWKNIPVRGYKSKTLWYAMYLNSLIFLFSIQQNIKETYETKETTAIDYLAHEDSWRYKV